MRSSTTICSACVPPSLCPEKKLQADTLGWNFDSLLFWLSIWFVPTFHVHRYDVIVLGDVDGLPSNSQLSCGEPLTFTSGHVSSEPAPLPVIGVDTLPF